MRTNRELGSGAPSAGARAAGAWLAFGALLLTAALFMHPPPEAEPAAFLALIASEGGAWRVVHWMAAGALASFAVAGLLALSSGSLARTASAKSAWAVLTVGALATFLTAVSEATVIADAAAADDLTTFAAWQTFAGSLALGFAFLGLAVAGMGVSEARKPTSALPRWAAYAVVPLGIGAFIGWMLGPVAGFPAGGPIWLVSSLAMNVWLIAYGISVLRLSAKVAAAEAAHA